MDIMDFIGMGINIFDRLDKWHNLKQDVDAKIRLLYLECRRNLALLDCINEESIHTETGNIEILKLFKLLETDILELIFMDGEQGNKLFKALSKNMVNADLENDDGESAADNKNKINTTVIQTAMYCYVRISVLKKLGSISDEITILKNIHYKKRLSNMRKALLAIIKNLQHFESIKILDKMGSTSNKRVISETTMLI